MSLISDRISEFKHIYDVKVPISKKNLTLVPARAKMHAKEFVSSKHPRQVVQMIYEEGFPLETGAVILCLYKSRMKEYTDLMGEETRFQILKEITDKGDGVILK